MPAYAYAIKIDRNRQTVSETLHRKLPDEELSLSDLRDLGVKETDTFYIASDEKTMLIYRKRPETDEEMSKRIAKEENYMKEYNKRHGK